MGLTRAGRIALAGALAVALIAVFWPGDKSDSSDGAPACPLGFMGDNPHVPGATGTPSNLVLWYNGTVWTGEDEATTVEALLLDSRQGLILGTGSLEAVTQLAAGAGGTMKPVLRDLKGRFLMPGFIDPHVHFLPGGLLLAATDLTTANSKERFQQLVAQHIAELEKQEVGEGSLRWVEGGQWDEGRWGGQLPDRRWLDEVTSTSRPALLRRLDAHMALANTRALQLANITRHTPDPLGGIIDRDTAGEPTGILRENAMGLVQRHVPEPSQTQLKAALQRATEYALSRGVTSVGCMGRWPFTGDPETSWQDLEQVFLPAADEGGLKLRVMAFMPLTTWQRLQAYVLANGHHHAGSRLLWGGVKAFADGSLGSRTALMWEPYSDAAQDNPDGGTVEYGTRMMGVEEMYELVRGADSAGLTVAVHAIGDKAVDDVVDVVRRVRLTNSALHGSESSTGATVSDPAVTHPGWFHSVTTEPRDSGAGEAAGVRKCDADGVCEVQVSGPRHRVEHMQHVSGTESARVAARMGVSATPNPLHLVADGEVMQQRLGSIRAGPGRSYPFRTLRKTGLTLGMASDWPIADMNPLAGVYVSVFRSDPAQPNGTGYSEEESLSVGEALLAHTAHAAYLNNMEHWVGSLRPGLRGDLVVLGSSPLAMTRGSKLPEVLESWVDGHCVHGCVGTAV